MDFLPSNKSRGNSELYKFILQFVYEINFRTIARKAEVSQPSLGAEQDDRYELSSPPASPMYAEGTSQGSQTKNKQTTFSQKFRKYHDSSLDDDTESELVAIPESDQSDSTLHGGSAPVSQQLFDFFDFQLIDDIVRVLLTILYISRKL